MPQDENGFEIVGDSQQQTAAQKPTYQFSMPAPPDRQYSVGESEIVPSIVPSLMNRAADFAVNLPVRLGYSLERLRRALPSVDNYFRTPQEKSDYQNLPTPHVPVPQIPERSVTVEDAANLMAGPAAYVGRQIYSRAVRPVLEAADATLGAGYEAVRAAHPERFLAQDSSGLPPYQFANVPQTPSDVIDQFSGSGEESFPALSPVKKLQVIKPSDYKSRDDVVKDFKSGKLSRADAAKLLNEKFGVPYK